MISRQRLLQLFLYDPSRGQFYWMNPPKNMPHLLGNRAGAVQHHGHTDYWFIKIDGLPRLEHRLVWCIETGDYPKFQIDHMNGNGLDNRFCNLRDVTCRTNLQNKRQHRAGKLPGYYWCKDRKLWRTQCTINGERLYLGYFKTEKEAHERYLAELKNRGCHL